MLFPFLLPRPATLLCLTLVGAPSLLAFEEAQSSHPIGRIARVINLTLSDLEARLDKLSARQRSLAAFSPKPLTHGYGWYASRPKGSEQAPSITLDLGDTYPLSEIFIVPDHPRAGESGMKFPLRLRVDTALEPDFSDAKLLYETRNRIHEDQDGYPLRITSRDIDARYVRVSIPLGHFRGEQSVAALSEVVIISGGEPVSFGAKVSATHSHNSPGEWDPVYINDGRTPLGTWEGVSWTASSGGLVEVNNAEEPAKWIVDLKSVKPIDRVVLFPYQFSKYGGTSSLPSEIKVTLTNDPEEEGSPANFIRGGRSFAPLVIPFQQDQARYIVIHSKTPSTFGRRHLHALSEIEVWSQGRNVATDHSIRLCKGHDRRDASAELNDGYASGLEIKPVGRWLQEINERRSIQAELDRLSPVCNSMATETELNATWGASVVLGLSFLIPVAFVERRRLVSRKQIDSLRKRIASDLHDDIGSNLGSISLIARSAKRDLRRLEGPTELAEDLDEVEVIARESSLAMRDIVWLLERRQDSIGDFVQRMQDSASRLLRDLDYKLTCESNRTAAKMTLDAKRHLFLYYKEALHNILKHSEAKKVTIRIRDKKDCLVMEIEDDGKGLPIGEDGRPQIVRKLTDRAAVLEGRLDVESKPGRGTRLRLEVKRANLVTPKAST